MPLFIVAFIVKDLLPRCLRCLPLPRKCDEFGLLWPNEWMKLFTFSILCGAAAYRVAVSCFRREQADLRKHVKRSFSFSQLGRQVINTRDIAPGTKFCRCLKSKDFPYCDGSHNVFSGICDGDVKPLVISHRLLRNFPKTASCSSQSPQYTKVENSFEFPKCKTFSFCEDSEEDEYYESPNCYESYSRESFCKPQFDEGCSDYDDNLNDFDLIQSRLASTRVKIDDLWSAFESKDGGTISHESKFSRSVGGDRNKLFQDGGCDEDFSFIFD